MSSLLHALTFQTILPMMIAVVLFIALGKFSKTDDTEREIALCHKLITPVLITAIPLALVLAPS